MLGRDCYGGRNGWLMGGSIDRLDVGKTTADQAQTGFSLDGIEQGVGHEVIDLCGSGEDDRVENDNLQSRLLKTQPGLWFGAGDVDG